MRACLSTAECPLYIGRPAVSPALAYSVTPAAASAAVLAYAAHINDVVFANTAASPLPPQSLATVNVNVVNPNVPLQLGVDEVRRRAASGVADVPTHAHANTTYPHTTTLTTVLHAEHPCGRLCGDDQRQHDIRRLHGPADTLAGHPL